MSIRNRISNTNGNVTLAQHDMVTDAEVAAAGADIMRAWGGATQQEAAQNSMKFMVNAWRKETIQRLKNLDGAASLVAHHAAENASAATYEDRFEPVP